MSTILEHPQAQELLAQTEVEPDTVRRCRQQLTHFIQRYLPCFYRDEQRQHAQIILQGKLTGLQRKTTEPIALEADLKRRPLQHFVGAGGWDDNAVLTELRCHVTEELGDSDGVLVLDPSAFPKKGTDSCGVARQWCGRLGKVDNCQTGVFLAYVAPRGKALVDCRLFLPVEQAADRRHRHKTYVPKAITFQEKWRIGLDLVRTAGQELPHGWVVGDDEFGRVTDLRVQLRLAKERYVLDVPCNTQVRDVSARRPPSRPGGKPRLPLFERVDQWAKRQPKKRWKKIRLPGGEKGPREVWAVQQRVQTRDEEGHIGPTERLVVIKACGRDPQVWYTLSNATVDVPLAPVVVAHSYRHGVEELFEDGNQEVGLSHYEVRSWTGWHHHMTLSLLALWFVQRERLLIGKKNPGITASLVRLIFTELLRCPAPTAREVARKVSAKLRRTEEARIYHWYERTRKFPTPRPEPGARPPGFDPRE
jgi:SRSO17 transposase